MKPKVPVFSILFRLTSTLLVLWVLTKAGWELFGYAWGTGSWLGGFTLRHGLVFMVLVLGLACIFAAIAGVLWQRQRTIQIERVLSAWRDRLGRGRWIVMIPLVLFPVWFLQYSQWGGEFTGLSFRGVIFFVTSWTVGALLTRSHTRLTTLPNLSIGLLLVTSALVCGTAAVTVTDYPFSLSWSEGNRMWDYSILFGRALYDYPANRSIFAYIDPGRQSLWGLPFLLPNTSIVLVRFWNAFLITVPYAVLGWIVFRKGAKSSKLGVLCGLWTMIFLSQGPIYTPLVLIAILIAIAWSSPPWIAIILIFLAGCYVNINRFTWIFAPAMWASMIYFGEIKIFGRKPDWRKLRSASAATLAGLLGGYILPRWQTIGHALTTMIVPGYSPEIAIVPDSDIVSVGGLSSAISRQPLLWERLLPNPTYETGISLGLLGATLPIILFMIYLVRARRWQVDWFGGSIVLVNLALFLSVGIVISVKIGGGSNLHNLDMFLIGLVFTAALAWEAGGYRELMELEQKPKWLQTLFVFMMILLAYPTLRWMRPLQLPPSDYVERTLNQIQVQVAVAKGRGEILFLDQRQLLTFGYIKDVPLVVEYEKKFLMDNAMAGDAQYFEQFHRDLLNRRFSLIVSEPLFKKLQGSDDQFGEENDAWVKWVSKKILCYYRPLSTFREARVQLLVPRDGSLDCH